MSLRSFSSGSSGQTEGGIWEFWVDGRLGDKLDLVDSGMGGHH